VVAGDATNVPSYAQVTLGGTLFVWASPTTSSRALQTYSGSSRIASTWYASGPYTIDVNVTDHATHQLGIYVLDWDSGGRSERIDVLDAATGAVLSTCAVSAFTGGQYAVWNVGGHVTFRITPLAGNAVASGLFFR
jgi:hypothetical protein